MLRSKGIILKRLLLLQALTVSVSCILCTAVFAGDTAKHAAPTDKVDVHPKKIALGNVSAGSEKKVALRLINKSGEELKISSVSISVPHIAVMIKKLDILKNNPGEVEVTVNPKVSGLGKESGSVYIYIDSIKDPIIVPVSWVVK